ncbi:alcohol dehydrogenase-like 1 isoform X1 [Coffea eugenioides]|uniref:alcohol dehydrogenase-like 1 isoform X1 n=2 Tax=Coffea eugenioides TaxID=49369 RepID=UPI000F608B29|nr:alcohol dehydrogenase-like 1 isoform X1 [Coffea eugenioides]
MEAKFRSDTAGKPIRCRAAVCRGAGEPLVMEEIQVAPPKIGEVRVKIICTSLCHGDISFWRSESGPFSFFPGIFGHEAAGIVESVGENVVEVQAGDLVLPVVQRNCGECRDCKFKGNACTKFPAASLNAMPRDGSSRFLDKDGQPLHHFLFASSFSEYTVVDMTHLVKISPEVPVDKACLLSCGVTTGVGATMKAAQIEEGSTVAIFGLGTVGLAVAEGARIRGASKIIGIDKNLEKFEIAKKFGVTDFVNPTSCGKDSVSQVIREMTDGGADYCFECVGSTSLIREAFDGSRQGCGKTVILGADLHGSPLSIHPLEILTGKSIMGATLGGIKPKQDIPHLAQKYLKKELRLDGFITHEVNFEDINKAFDLLLQGKSLRCIIWMDR